MSGKCAVIVDILGQHFDWQQILRQVESDILELRWRFYHFDGICDGYGQIDYAAFNTEDEFDSNANEFGDGIDYVFDSNAEEEYEIISSIILNEYGIASQVCPQYEPILETILPSLDSPHHSKASYFLH